MLNRQKNKSNLCHVQQLPRRICDEECVEAEGDGKGKGLTGKSKQPLCVILACPESFFYSPLIKGEKDSRQAGMTLDAPLDKTLIFSIHLYI